MTIQLIFMHHENGYQNLGRFMVESVPRKGETVALEETGRMTVAEVQHDLGREHIITVYVRRVLPRDIKLDI